MPKEDRKEIGITVKKSEDISEWYTQAIIKSGFADYSAVSGCIVFRPPCYAIWEKIVAEVDKRLKNMGVKNAYFPLLIPESLLKKEQAHVEGFTPEVAWVTQTGNTQLDERLAVRPTSETIMYDSYSKWIRSWRDLPLKLNQWNSVVRWEFKHPVPLLRTREFLWNEGHTAFATLEEANKEIEDIMNLWVNFCENWLALPSLPGKKTQQEKFAGALNSFSVEFFLPSGKGIQGPDAHSDGQNFAKAFNIKFLNDTGKEEFVYQNTWAITTRVIGIIAMVHGDDKGLVIPPKVAPIQAVIVPILFDETKEKVLKEAKKIKDSLKDFSVNFDDRDGYTPGWKFNEWELKGIPLRIEVGPKDVANEQCVIVRRDTGEKCVVKIKEVPSKVNELLDAVQKNLFDKAKKFLDANTVHAKNWDEFKKAIGEKKLVIAPWCESAECADKIKDDTEGAKVLNIPFGQPKKVQNNCAHCGKSSKIVALFAKSY